MIRSLSNKLANWLLCQSIITEDEIPIYRYAAYNILYTAIPVFIMLIIGFIIGTVIGSLLFILTFILLRKYTGGFHFNSPVLCMIVSIITEFLFMYLAKLISDPYTLIMLITASSCSLLLLSPVPSENRPLDNEEILYCKNKLKQILVFLFFFCYSLYVIGYTALISFPISAMTMTAITQYPAVLKKGKRNK